MSPPIVENIDRYVLLSRHSVDALIFIYYTGTITTRPKVIHRVPRERVCHAFPTYFFLTALQFSWTPNLKERSKYSATARRSRSLMCWSPLFWLICMLLFCTFELELCFGGGEVTGASSSTWSGYVVSG